MLAALLKVTALGVTLVAEMSTVNPAAVSSNTTASPSRKSVTELSDASFQLVGVAPTPSIFHAVSVTPVQTKWSVPVTFRSIPTPVSTKLPTARLGSVARVNAPKPPPSVPL